MIRFATVGTGFITDSFIKGALATGQMTLAAVHSRDKDKGRALAMGHGENIPVFTDLEDLAASDLIDAVYIASPNALHAPQARLFLSRGKHVLVEKSAASNRKELEEVMSMAEKKGLVFMEAMKTLTMPAYRLLKEILPQIGRVRRYTGIYCQYSSRYDRHKSGEYVNTFRKEFSNGSLLDIGIYCLYPMIDLFGMPDEIKGQSIILPEGGVDGQGTALFTYGDMNGVIIYSKIADSHLPSEIQGEEGTILIDRIGSPGKLTLISREGKRKIFSPFTHASDMYYEAMEFADTIKAGRSFSLINHKDLASSVHHVMDEIRHQSGLVYPADTL